MKIYFILLLTQCTHIHCGDAKLSQYFIQDTAINYQSYKIWV